MQTAIFKFLALCSVISLGCFVVYQVHTRIPPVGEQGPTADDFQSLTGETEQDGGRDSSPTQAAEPGLPAAQPGLPAAQGEPQPTLSLTGEAPGWDDVPVQSEPEPTADPFWSDDQAGLPTAETSIEASESSIVQADEPGVDPEAWSLFGQPDDVPTAESSAEAIETVGYDEDDSDPAPRTLSPLGDVQPLPDAFIPEDEESQDEPGEPFADTELLPVQGVEATVPANPFAASSETPDSGTPNEESDQPPLLELPTETDAGQDPPVNPFDGFPASSASSEPILPAAPDAAGFAESDPVPVPPQVSENPFAFPADDEDPVDEPVIPPDADSAPAIDIPVFGADLGPDPRVTGEEVEPAPPVLPLPEVEPSLTPVESDAAPNPFSFIPDDEEPAPAASPAFDPFASQSPEPTLPESGPDDSAMTLDLTGDAIIDRDSVTGAQQPELEIQKIAPPEATVGAPLIYAIHIRNVGRSAAHGVVVEDRIPRGTILDGTIPQAELTDKVLTWNLGTIEPGQEETIRIKVTPTEAGEIGSVATVRFAAEVSAATSITSADLRLEMDGPQEISLGETVVFRYTLTNAGNGPARGAYIRCLLPPAFEHPGGSDIEYDVGDLAPGQTSEVELEVRAVEAGSHMSQVLLNANGRTYDEAELSVNVLPSRLLISREGPARRFVGRSARYSTVVTNRSSIELTGVSVIEQLPEALELAGIPAEGTYDPRNRTITWTIPRLSPGASVTIDSALVAREYGLHSSTIIARDRDGNEAHVTSDLQVAGFSTLEVDWEHDGKPVAVGEQVAMRLTIRNEGTAPARDVEAVFEVPPQMEFVNAQGPVSYLQEGRLIRFESVNELAINGEQSFDIVLTAAAPGNTRVSAQLRTADHTEPLRHDEPLFILADEN